MPCPIRSNWSSSRPPTIFSKAACMKCATRSKPGYVQRFSLLPQSIRDCVPLDIHPPMISPSSEMQFRRMRDTARDIFQRALAEASISKVFSRRIECDHGCAICDDLYDLHAYPCPFVVSIGKAGHTMVQALAARTGDQLEASWSVPKALKRSCADSVCFRGPPTYSEQRVGACGRGDSRLPLSAQNASSLVIYLLSGGARRWRRSRSTTNLARGSDRDLSRAGAFRRADRGDQRDSQAFICHQRGTHGAGRLSGAASFNPDLRRTRRNAGCARFRTHHARLDHGQRLSAHRVGAQVARGISKSVSELFQRHAIDETPKSDDPAFVHSRWWTVLSNKIAVEEAGAVATSHGFAVEIDNSCDDWDYERAANYFSIACASCANKFRASA